jgi:hypothetical protein
VLEVALFTAALILFADGSVPAQGARRRGWSLAAVLVLAFWSWMGSALHLLPALLAAATWHLLDDEAADGGLRALAFGGLAGAALLAASVACLGAPGALASGATTGVGGLHVALLAAAGSFAALLVRLRRAKREGGTRRRLGARLAVALPGAVLLLVPSLRRRAAASWRCSRTLVRPDRGVPPALGTGAGLGNLLGSSAYSLVHLAAAFGLWALVVMA